MVLCIWISKSAAFILLKMLIHFVKEKRFKFKLYLGIFKIQSIWLILKKAQIIKSNYVMIAFINLLNISAIKMTKGLISNNLIHCFKLNFLSNMFPLFLNRILIYIFCIFIYLNLKLLKNCCFLNTFQSTLYYFSKTNNVKIEQIWDF